MVTLTHVLIGIAAVIVYVVYVLFRPYGKCWRCHGQRILRPPQKKGRRPGKARACPVCHGEGHAPTPGAQIVHALLWELAGDRIRQRRRDEIAERVQRQASCRCVLEGAPNPLCPVHGRLAGYRQDRP